MISGTRILAIMIKELLQLSRDRLTYAMILVMPVMQLMLFGYAINTDPRHLPTVVLDEDRTTLSRSVLAALGNTGYFDFTAEAASHWVMAQAGPEDAKVPPAFPPTFCCGVAGALDWLRALS